MPVCRFLFDYQKETEYEIGGQQDEISEAIRTEISKYLRKTCNSTGSWRLLWRYIPSGADDDRIDFDLVPNFKKMNEAAIQLADSEKRKQFIEKVIKVIETDILSLLQ